MMREFPGFPVWFQEIVCFDPACQFSLPTGEVRVSVGPVILNGLALVLVQELLFVLVTLIL
jgi:hypothetical protein